MQIWRQKYWSLLTREVMGSMRMTTMSRSTSIEWLDSFNKKSKKKSQIQRKINSKTNKLEGSSIPQNKAKNSDYHLKPFLRTMLTRSIMSPEQTHQRSPSRSRVMGINGSFKESCHLSSTIMTRSQLTWKNGRTTIKSTTSITIGSQREEEEQGEGSEGKEEEEGRQKTIENSIQGTTTENSRASRNMLKSNELWINTFNVALPPLVGAISGSSSSRGLMIDTRYWSVGTFLHLSSPLLTFNGLSNFAIFYYIIAYDWFSLLVLDSHHVLFMIFQSSVQFPQ